MKAYVHLQKSFFQSRIVGIKTYPSLKRQFTNEPNNKIETKTQEQDDLLPEFKKLNVNKLVRNALHASNPNVITPTPVQTQAIPLILKWKSDVVIASHTGSGKTYSFLVPLVQMMKDDENIRNIPSSPNRPRALILVPNRELSTQTLGVVKSLSHTAKFSSTELISTNKMRNQREDLNKNIDLVVATPGRLLHHKNNENMFVSQVRYLVIDEADTLLDKDFGQDVDKILGMLSHPEGGAPVSKFNYRPQSIIVTAALTNKLEQEIDKRWKKVTKVKTATLHKPVDTLRHEFIESPTGDKHGILVSKLNKLVGKRVIVFCNNMNSCRSTDHFLTEKGFKTACFHGEVPASERDANWESFVKGDKPILVCTDIASRGLDTVFVEHVILFDFPLNPIDYLHRVGRTARIGQQGTVTSIITKRDQVLAAGIKRALKERSTLDKLSSNKKDYEKNWTMRLNKR